MLDGVYPRDEAHVSQVLEETKMLARLIEDLRTLANSEGGTLALHKEPTDLVALIDEAVASYRPQVEAAGGRVNGHRPADLPPIDIDPTRVREVLMNLLSNAVRHLPAGGAVAVDLESHGSEVVVHVRDNGPGIAADDLPRIFDRFHKGSASGGSGLGLTIARNLVMAHGGTIGALSTPGQGTTITFTLPAGA
jgi:signal transduction histidine kinase